MLPSPDVRHAAAATTGEVCAPCRVGERRGERGAVLVHAAVAMAGLLAFSALTIDLGSVWVVRAQAQNAADAAALAGTVSLAYVSPTDMDAARAAAQAIAGAHRVWGDPVPAGATQVTTGTCPAGSPSVTGQCVNVTVVRGSAYGTPLPTFFSRLVGGTATNVRASASGKVLTGNSTSCLRPLALTDSWDDRVDATAPIDHAWTSDDVFDGYDGEGNVIGPRDHYQPPDSESPGSGMTVTAMVGRRIVRQLQDPEYGLPIGADSFFSLDLPRAGMEGDSLEDRLFRYQANLRACSGQSFAVDIPTTVFAPHRPRYTFDPLFELIQTDPSAVWDAGRGAVVNSAFSVSPRIITIGVIDPHVLSMQRRLGRGTAPTQLRNLVGFFVERVDADAGVQLTGVVVPVPGRFDQNAPTITADAAFLRSVALVR